MASAARLLAPFSRRGVVSVALAGVERRRPEAASLMGAPVLATVEACASIKVVLQSLCVAREQRQRIVLVDFFLDGAACIELLRSSAS
uniref:Uncharacterized protein n=1 Tax=Zea mays TaxID=4577 RepID=B6UDA8_MAIZE|nr:hypothetical protein [Zea mays]